jgi:hypothetical protein
MRRYGTSRIRAAYASGVSQAARLIGVRMAPGASPITRMPSAAYSWAMLFIRRLTPPLEAA